MPGPTSRSSGCPATSGRTGCTTRRRTPSCSVSGTGLTLADVGGDFARELGKADGEAAIEFARSELRAIFGGAIARYLVKGHVIRWGANKLTRGSYASAEPGAYRLRAVLRRPVGDRVWFAGEACSVGDWATVHGAHESGQNVARLVAAGSRIAMV